MPRAKTKRRTLLGIDESSADSLLVNINRTIAKGSKADCKSAARSLMFYNRPGGGPGLRDFAEVFHFFFEKCDIGPKRRRR